MTHTDAWTGAEIEGQAAIVQTTEGPQVVDIRQVRVRADIDATAEKIDAAAEAIDTTSTTVAGLAARVDELERQLSELQAAQTPEPEPEPAPAAAKATTTRKAASK